MPLNPDTLRKELETNLELTLSELRTKSVKTLDLAYLEQLKDDLDYLVQTTRNLMDCLK